MNKLIANRPCQGPALTLRFYVGEDKPAKNKTKKHKELFTECKSYSSPNLFLSFSHQRAERTESATLRRGTVVFVSMMSLRQGWEMLHEVQVSAVP